MRSRLLLPLLAGLLVFGAAHAQTPPSPQAIAHFTGTGPQVTDPFTVADGWVVRWTAFRLVNISVLGPDGSLVAGAAAPRGALYVAKGGTYHLQIEYTPRPANSSAPASAPANGRPGATDFAARPYEIQVVQQSTAVATPSATNWIMENYNLPGKGVANFSNMNGEVVPATPAPYRPPVPSSTPAPVPANNQAPAPAPSSAPPPDAGA